MDRGLSFVLVFKQNKLRHCVSTQSTKKNLIIQGVSKKMLVSGKMAITSLWKELGEEVIPFSKTTGTELSDEDKNFMIPSKND